MIKLAIFDMDGTICNTIDDLADATNFAMNTLGYPLHTVEEYKYFVGNGIPKLIYRALPEGKKSEQEVAHAKELMLNYYGVHFADKSVPYEGITELLAALKDKGIHIAVCTNKAHHMAKEVAKKLFDGIFDEVIGQSDGRPLKPDAYSPKEIMTKYGVTPQETVFIGDSGVDMQTAINSGTESIGVTWGFRTAEELKENGARHIVDAPCEILDLISKM